MPKEYVDSICNVFPGDSEAPSNPPLRVRVGWSRERGDVEIRTVNPSTEESFDANGGWNVWLDRRGINDLIRILRRARDQAFGRDE